MQETRPDPHYSATTIPVVIIWNWRKLTDTSRQRLGMASLRWNKSKDLLKNNLPKFVLIVPTLCVPKGINGNAA